LRTKHPAWGARTIVGILARTHGAATPSVATVARLLRRLGRVKRRQARVRVWSVDARPQIEVHACNDLWTIDFKGWWLAGNGQRCEPLTVRDAHSRFVLATTLVAHTSGAVVRRVLTRLFRRYGVPRAILADNGTPWVCMRSRGGLTQLSAWLVSLGISFHRTRVGCPQDNGGHERMHGSMAELEAAPSLNRRGEQRRSDRWRLEFNEVRPHQALGGKTPAEVYRVTERRVMHERQPVYAPEWATRRVRADGKVSFQGDAAFIGMALPNRLIGLKYEAGLRWRAYFFQVDLGLIEFAVTTGVMLMSPSTGPDLSPDLRPG